MADEEKISVASEGLKIRKVIAQADEESAPIIDAPGYDKKIADRFMGAIESVVESVGPKGDVRIVGRRRHAKAQIIPFRKPSGGGDAA